MISDADLSTVDPGAAQPGIVVAVLTYRRPALLAELLPTLVAEAGRLAPPARVVVVDNDAEASAEAVVAPWCEKGVEYYVEPTPGITVARNRALDACAGADAVVFLDDDEMPRSGWLATLVDAWRRWECDGVAGPVLTHLPDDVEPWVRASPAFQRRTLDTGASIASAATNNLLLDLRTLDRLGLRFDSRFGLTGGGDTLLTRTLVQRGGVIRWCAEAVVSEPVPPERATRQWMLRRKTRSGNVWSRVELHERRGLARGRTRTVLTFQGLAILLRGAARIVAGLVTRDLATRAEGECDVATARGVLGGAHGRVVTEYRRPQ